MLREFRSNSADGASVNPLGPEDQSPTAPVLRGVLETALYCDDLEQVFAFYHVVLGAEVLFHDERLVALDAGTGTVLLPVSSGRFRGRSPFSRGIHPTPRRCGAGASRLCNCGRRPGDVGGATRRPLV